MSEINLMDQVLTIAVCKVSWLNKTNVHSFGAQLYKDGVRSAADCLNVCEKNAWCVAVEVDYKYWPVRCWVYNDPFKLLYTAPIHNVIQYRVLARHCHDPSRSCTFSNCQFNPAHYGLCDSNKLLYKRCAKSMGRPKFRPPTATTFFNRS